MTSSTFASLSMPLMEDSMDMASPADQPVDHDIDIDFGDFGGGDSIQFTDDEQMIEDSEPVRPGTSATDDMMADDEHIQVTSMPAVVEEEMHDSDDVQQSAQQESYDEELIDYDEEIYPEQSHLEDADVHIQEGGNAISAASEVPQTAESSFLAPTDVLTQADGVDEEIERQPEDAVIPEPVNPIATGPEVLGQAVAAHEVAPEITPVENLEVTQNDDALFDNPKLQAASAETLTETAHELSTTEDPADIADADSEEAESTPQKPLPHSPGFIDVSGDAVNDGPPTPTDTGLHAMTIAYSSYEWPLFKSRSQPEGLLKNDNLVNVSLADLLQNCRKRLALKVDEQERVTEDQDLVLGFGRIGLMLVECSTHASTTSLNDILDVYLQLHRNDDVVDIPPLELTLTTQLKFTSHLKMLKDAASTGTGLSTYVTIDDGEDEGVSYEGGEEEEQSHEDIEGGEQYTYDEEESEAPAENEGETRDDLEYAADQEQNDEGAQEAHFDPSQEYADGHDFNAESYADDSFQEAADENHHEERPEHEADILDDEYVEEHVEDAALPSTNIEKYSEPESNVSSATVPGTTVNSNTELHGDDGNEDFSKLLTQDGVDDNSRLLAEQASSVVNHTSGESSKEHKDPGYEYGAEDGFFDGDLIEYQEDDVPEQPSLTDEPAASPTQNDDDTARPVDAANEAQAGEDEDQFHTALDVLDDDAYEQETAGTHAEPAVSAAKPEVDEDDIGFDTDDEDVAAPPAARSASSLLTSKRSFEEATDEDEIDFDEPDQKKARSG